MLSERHARGLRSGRAFALTRGEGCTGGAGRPLRWSVSVQNGWARGMAIVVLELDEEFQVAVARTLVEAPHSALIAVADPKSRAGHIAVADDYEEALRYAEEFIALGWRAAVWEVPTRRPAR